MRDQQIRAVLFEFFKLRDGFVFQRQHLFAANDFHAWKLFQKRKRVGAGGLKRPVGPVDFRQWKITDFENFAHDVLLEYDMVKNVNLFMKLRSVAAEEFIHLRTGGNACAAS